MRDDPDFNKRLGKKVQAIKEDKQHILSAAQEYEEKYKTEIIEGTRKCALLLQEGKSKGLSETQIMQEYGRFIPTVRTPILNFLYFMLRESERHDSAKYRQRDAINEQLLRLKQLSHDEGEQDLNDAEVAAILDEKIRQMYVVDEKRKQVNEQFATEERFPEDEVTLKEPQEMVEYLYGNITLDQFSTLKKLKGLSQSDNIAEATAAFKKGKEMCIKLGLDWERIPGYKKSIK